MVRVESRQSYGKVLENEEYFTKHHKKGYDVFMTALVPAVPAPVQPSSQADTDAQMIELWLHGRSANTQAAYQHDIALFFNFVGKPIPVTTLRDFQDFADSIEGGRSHFPPAIHPAIRS